MTQITTEKKLTITYGLSLVTGLVVIITMAITWNHWGTTLDQCIYRNCSCILFGEYTPNIFLGGPDFPCYYVTYGPIIYVLFAVAFACFHGYRYLFMRPRANARTLMRKNDEGETVHMAVQSDDSSPLPKCFWMTLSTLSVLMVIYCSIHFIVFLVGYKRTCNEYRKTLDEQLHLRGSALPVIYVRLSCDGILDFMDYIHPVPENSFRYGLINTGLAMLIGMCSSFLTPIFFIFASFYNIKRARTEY